MENETLKLDEAGNLHKPPVGSSVCPTCNGDGWYSEHNDASRNYETGEHDCSQCPIQVQCEDCRATGFVTNEQLEEIKKYIERKKLQQKYDDAGLPF